MELTQGESAHELFQAQAHVWNHIFHFMSSMSLKCAVELGIPDIIHDHGRPMTLFELVDALPVAPTRTGHVHRLMRLTVHSGFFVLQKNGDGEEGYVLTPSSRLLLKESSMSLSTLTLMILDPVLINPWQSLSRWFQGKEGTAMETFHGMINFWEFMTRNPEFAEMFNVSMAGDSRFVMKVIVEECGEVFKGVGSIVDVGGGTGECATTIAKAFPHIKCTVLDLPRVVATVTRKARDLDFVGGDMFESIPKAEAIFLKWILHDWSDEDCVKILKRCKEAIPPREEGGKVIIVDMVVPAETAHGDPKSIQTQLYFDLLMMVIPGGKERDECEWRKIFMDAGFSQYKIVYKLGLRSLIELYP